MSKPLTVMTLAVPAALGAAALAAAGCGNISNAQTPPPATTQAAAPSPAAAPAKGTVDVTLKEYSIAPSATTVDHGRVTFDVKNAGAMKHELVILRTTKPAAQLGKANAARVSEAGHVGEVGDLAAGASGTTSVKLDPGHYVLVCNLPGHWMAGMRTDLTVR